MRDSNVLTLDHPAFFKISSIGTALDFALEVEPELFKITFIHLEMVSLVTFL
jgi:hypothetical protein